MAEPELLVERGEDGVALLTMNRPDRLNALSDEMLTLLLDALRGLAADAEVGCVVLTGAGRGFSAGGDMKARATGERPPPDTPEAGMDQLRARMEASRLLHEMPKPTIAMLNGVAAGAGMALALACDKRIAGEGARMTTAFAKMGFSGDFGGHWFLSRLVGPARARELYFTSEVLDSARMAALGLANRVVPDAAFAGRDDGPRPPTRRRAACRLALHEAQHESGRGGHAVGRAGRGSLRHDALPRNRGPPGSAARLRGKAAAGVQGALTAAAGVASKAGVGGGGPAQMSTSVPAPRAASSRIPVSVSRYRSRPVGSNQP